LLLLYFLEVYWLNTFPHTIHFSYQFRKLEDRKIEKTIKAPVVANYDSEKKSLLAGMAGQLQGGVSTALSKYVEVIDNRRFFSTNIRR